MKEKVDLRYSFQIWKERREKNNQWVPPYRTIREFIRRNSAKGRVPELGIEKGIMRSYRCNEDALMKFLDNYVDMREQQETLYRKKYGRKNGSLEKKNVRKHDHHDCSEMYVGFLFLNGDVTLIPEKNEGDFLALAKTV